MTEFPVVTDAVAEFSVGTDAVTGFAVGTDSVTVFSVGTDSVTEFSVETIRCRGSYKYRCTFLLMDLYLVFDSLYLSTEAYFHIL